MMRVRYFSVYSAAIIISVFICRESVGSPPPVDTPDIIREVGRNARIVLSNQDKNRAPAEEETLAN